MLLGDQAQTWIWYPGDMDIWTGNRINNLRTENGSFYPAFWRADSHCQTVEFQKVLESRKLSNTNYEEICILSIQLRVLPDNCSTTRMLF